MPASSSPPDPGQADQKPCFGLTGSGDQGVAKREVLILLSGPDIRIRRVDRKYWLSSGKQVASKTVDALIWEGLVVQAPGEPNSFKISRAGARVLASMGQRLPLTGNERLVMTLIATSLSPYHDCRTRSSHAGRQGVISRLRSKEMIDNEWAITEHGRLCLGLKPDAGPAVDPLFDPGSQPALATAALD